MDVENIPPVVGGFMAGPFWQRCDGGLRVGKAGVGLAQGDGQGR